jgi:hypothetical protein
MLLEVLRRLDDEHGRLLEGGPLKRPICII